MRPGWLISTFLISGIACVSARAESEAPPYLLVPALKSHVQASEAVSTSSKPELAVGQEILVGSGPLFTLEFADVRDNSGTGFDDPLMGSQRREVASAVFLSLIHI